MRIKKTGQDFSGNHEPLIDRELFERVQALLQRKNGGSRGRGIRFCSADWCGVLVVNIPSLANAKKGIRITVVTIALSSHPLYAR